MSSFIGSERSGCSIAIYGLAKRGLSFYSRGLGTGVPSAVIIDGTEPDLGMQILRCSSATSLGAGSQWQATLMCQGQYDPLTEIEVGSWVYVSYVRNGVSWLDVAGRISDVRVQESAGSGATVRICTLVGGGFESVYKETLWWFAAAQLEDERVEKNTAIGVDRLLNSPAQNVKNILYDFFRIIAAKGRATYRFPERMPGVSNTASDSIVFDSTDFDDSLFARRCFSAASMLPNADLWSLAQQHQDGLFCECIPIVLPKAGYSAYRQNPSLVDGLSPANMAMTILFRDKPFPLNSAGIGGQRGTQSSYYRLPTHVISRGDVVSIDTGISSQETFNSFTFTSAAFQEQIGLLAQTSPCLWSTADMLRRGMRKLDATSMYTETNADSYGYSKYNRERLRDWYAMGAELLQGGVQLSRGFPEMKVGSRLVVNGPDETDRLTFYIEGVRHSWSPGGLRTGLDVTRGYRGTDAEFQRSVDLTGLDYTLSQNGA